MQKNIQFVWGPWTHETSFANLVKALHTKQKCKQKHGSIKSPSALAESPGLVVKREETDT